MTAESSFPPTPNTGTFPAAGVDFARRQGDFRIGIGEKFHYRRSELVIELLNLKQTLQILLSHSLGLCCSLPLGIKL